jgi:predicted ATPase/DNA-binding winged helix-turn-helix (wHTH) protein
LLSPTSSEHMICFDSFQLIPTRRMLTEDGKPLRVGGRALDILIALVQRHGEVVGKSELLELVWPNTFVEEDNLKVHVSALRRVMGDGSAGKRYIVSAPGRGYAFVAPITFEFIDEKTEPAAQNKKRAHNLPTQLTRLIGRTAAVDRLGQQLERHRIITIVGAGGIGKTSVALAVAEQFISVFENGVWLVDLASVADAPLVPHALARVLGLETRDDNLLPSLINALRDKHLLIVLDNCEHVIQEAARVTAELMRNAPRVQILATSREPLRIESEHLYHLPSLDCPASSEALTAAEMQSYAAIQLFIERAADNLAEFQISDADAPIVAEICTRLDGIPLAIEFAAAYVGTLGLRGVVLRLEDRLRLLSPRRNAVIERHQTMLATHDWSYSLLDKSEQTILRRLACFTGNFTMDAASAVAAGDGIASSRVVDHVASLVAKSLVSVDVGGAVARYRLLETTRAYALEKLRGESELDNLNLRHATYFADFLDHAWSDKIRLFEEGGYASIADQLGNVRAGLQWIFSTAVDVALTIKFVAGAGLYFVELGLMTEARDWVGRTLEILDDSQRSTRYEMMLQYAYAHSMVITRGNTDDSGRAILRSIELATLLEDYDLQIRVLGGYHMFLSRSGDNRAAMQIALRANDVANKTNDPDAIAMADAMLSRSYYYAGDQEKAEACTRAAFQRAPLEHKINTIRFGNDQRVRALAGEASILWLVGRPKQAEVSIHQLLELSGRLGDPIAGVQAGYAASVVALQCGNWIWASELIGQLGAVAREHAIAPFPVLASSLEAELLFRTHASDTTARLSALLASFEAVRLSRYNPAYHGIAVIEALTHIGHHTEAKALLDDLVDEMKRKGQLLFIPEFLRLEGDILAARGQAAAGEALSTYQHAIQLASEQSALAWELRAATSLARFYRSVDPQKASTILLPVYQRYTEKHETVDLLAAKRLLDELSSE